jgi:Protein of unknown function (DUF4238)
VATNKNQHFVPRCYLRQFTVGGAGRAINLYNIDRGRFIEGAPVKNQCSGDYFYGKDPLLESAIQTVEQSYGTIVRKILQPSYYLTDEHRSALKLFWLLQHLRTEAASKRSVEMTNSMASIADPQNAEFRLQIREAVQVAMHTFADSMAVVSDLKVCLIRNRSAVPFVTSDDPAVLTNRWHLQFPKRSGLSFGLRSAGTILLLPLSPSILCISYDGDMHSIPHRDGWVDLRDTQDADAFNQHQYLNCRANIFVKDKLHFDEVRNAYLNVSKLRPVTRHKIHYAVLDMAMGEHKRYVVVDPATAGLHQEALIHSQTVHVSPTLWPRQISWRSNACVFYNGTGAGYVRKTSTNRRGMTPFKKLRAFSV